MRGRGERGQRDTRSCSSYPRSPVDARMSDDMELGPGVEFDLIRRMRERWGVLAVGLGDDAAVLQPPRGEQLVISVDAAIEGVHFLRNHLSLREIGYRADMAARSDRAAMAAAPRGVLVAL